jgi:NHL repeat
MARSGPYDRCGAYSCAGSSLDPIMAFSPDGKVLRHFGRRLFQMPHGLTVDDAGKVGVTDNAARIAGVRIAVPRCGGLCL